MIREAVVKECLLRHALQVSDIHPDLQELLPRSSINGSVLRDATGID
jgi:hypothetical protein